MRSLGVHRETGLGMSAMAIEAKPARDVEGENYAVALLDAADGLAYVFDDAHDLVADDRPALQGSAAVIHVRSLPHMPLVVTLSRASVGA